MLNIWHNIFEYGADALIDNEGLVEFINTDKHCISYSRGHESCAVRQGISNLANDDFDKQLRLPRL